MTVSDKKDPWMVNTNLFQFLCPKIGGILEGPSDSYTQSDRMVEYMYLKEMVLITNLKWITHAHFSFVSV